MPTGVIFTLFRSSVDGDGLSFIVIGTSGSFNKSGVFSGWTLGVTVEPSALAAISFASSTSGTGV